MRSSSDPPPKLVLSPLTMEKGSSKSSRVAATTLPPLKQARLVRINDHVKSVRHKPTAPNSNSALDKLKQSGLAAFGFGGAKNNTPDETPPPKRRKQLATDLEVPETQFSLNTQSPELCGYGPFASNSGAIFGEEYSSPLSSPPSEISSPVSPPLISSFAAMPPPAAPVTPKRRRVTEVPDSKSPPVTPFTPYASQQWENWLDLQLSPTARKSISPLVPRIEEYPSRNNECHNPTHIELLPQRLFTSSLKRVQQQDKGSEEEARKVRETEGVAEIVEEAFEDTERTIKSSQWWENEDTQDFPLSTQATQEEEVNKNTTTSIIVGHDTAPQEPGGGLVNVEESFRVDLSYGGDPPTEDTDENEAVHGSQGVSGMDQEEVDMQESFRSMTYPVLEFHGDTPEPEPAMGDDPLTYEDLPSSTASQEDPEDVNDSQEYPAYGAYRTQQLPSSFYQHNNYRLSSPEIPPSSQFPPQIVDELGPTGDDSRDQRRVPLFLSEVTGKGLNAGDEGDDNYDKEGLSQVLPTTIDVSDPATTRDDSQFLPVLINEFDAEARRKRADDNHEDGQDIGIKDKDDDSEGGQVNWHDGTVTRSQLLPSELMETFPMPPPLSQFSSYGPYGYEYDESETQ